MSPLLTTRDALADELHRLYCRPGRGLDSPAGASQICSGTCTHSADLLLTRGALVAAESLARKIAERVIFDQELGVDDAAGLWMLIVHDGDTGRDEDWAEAYRVAAAMTARTEVSK